MNIKSYDIIEEKIDKNRTWIDINKQIILSREINYRKYYLLTKRYNPDFDNYEYYIILLDTPPTDSISYKTKLDNYGRIKIKLYSMFDEAKLHNITKNCNIDIIHCDGDSTGDAYKILF